MSHSLGREACSNLKTPAPETARGSTANRSLAASAFPCRMVRRTLLVYRDEFEGDVAAGAPIGELVGPFGLGAIENALRALKRNPPPNILIEGETGTGKELAATALAHRLRPGRPYVPVNVAGVASGVFESQLFGHVAGAFSDARRPSKGLVATHEGGVVFLDEIGELPLELQPKLLRLLENREVLPVGAERPHKVDVLIIAATNRSLAELVEQGRFRRDLHARLSTAVIRLPALRERAADLFAIAQAVAPRCGLALDAADPHVEVEAVERLLLEPWPNNVRGLVAALTAIAAIDSEPGLR
jgi:DNA-binding NtrC family response regulator